MSEEQPKQAENADKGNVGEKIDPSIQRLQIYVGLIKFLIGTVALGAITLFLNEQYRRAQLNLEEEKNRHAIQLQERRAESARQLHHQYRMVQCGGRSQGGILRSV